MVVHRNRLDGEINTSYFFQNHFRDRTRNIALAVRTRFIPDLRLEVWRGKVLAENSRQIRSGRFIQRALGSASFIKNAVRLGKASISFLA